MKRIGFWVTVAAAVLSVTAMAQVTDTFTVYLGDARGNPFVGPVPEGTTAFVVVKGTGRYCGMDQFPADILIFDFKTGAYIMVMDDPDTEEFEGAWFRELGGPGSGLFFWVTGRNSSTKVSVQLGSRLTFGGLGQTLTGYLASYLSVEDAEDAVEFLAFTHWTGLVVGAPTGYDEDGVPWLPFWNEGDYEYLDSNIGWGGTTDAAWLPQDRVVQRTALLPRFDASEFGVTGDVTLGRLENNDTIIVVVRDLSDPEGKSIDQGQVKIVDTEAKLTVTPPSIDYGCPGCPNLKIVVEDPDENLNPSEIEYVPVFVILNPGSWNVVQTQVYGLWVPWLPVNNFCSLVRWGGWFRVNDDFLPAWDVDRDGNPDPYDPDNDYQFGAPIRWYNIYANRWINYEEAINAGWYNSEWVNDLSSYYIRAVLFVPETGPNTGVFEINLGNLEDFQQFLWNTPQARNYKLPRGTTISFYYIDPNDFDDMDLAWVRVGYPDTGPNAPYSITAITDPLGHSAITGKVKLGWDGLYIRVYDKDADVEWCCCDRVVVHICDPHNEDDSEYVILDETDNSSGIFFTQAAVRLMPVWDAVAGYQLVFDDWRIQAYNEDTIFVQYNSVDYMMEDLNALGDGDPNTPVINTDEDEEPDYSGFPPRINYAADRNQYWDISFAKVRVYDTQVFDGQTHKMWFADCAGNKLPGPVIPYGGQVGLVVEDPDQNEEPRLREFISGNWDARYDTAPFWFVDDTGAIGGVFVTFFGLEDSSVLGLGPAPKIFVLNPRNGRWEILRLVEVRPDSGLFRSTVCVDLAGPQSLGARPGDTIFAFYQDPSNHSDVSIISMKVGLGGAVGVTPAPSPTVSFDRTSYAPGDRVVLTVTDPKYKDWPTLEGTDLLVVKAADNTIFLSWNSLVAVDPANGVFRAEGTIPADFTKFGTITAMYKDPDPFADRTAVATARVERVRLTDVTDVDVVPNPVTGNTVSFKIKAVPAGAIADEITVVVYDLTGREIWTDTARNTDTLTWTGGVLANLRSTAYIYVATVKWGTNQKVFKGFLYIKR